MTSAAEEGFRVEDVFKAAPGNQKVLLETMEACRQPRTPSELDAVMDRVLNANRSVYRPVELRALLEQFGALVYEPSEEEQAVRAAREADEEFQPAVDEDGNLVIVVPAEGTWRLTEAGEAYLAEDPVGEYAQSLFVKDAVYLPVYRSLLEFAVDRPREKAEIDALVDPHPLVQNPRLFSGYFLGELEKADVMEWSGAWQLTRRGCDVLALFRAEKIGEQR